MNKFIKLQCINISCICIIKLRGNNKSIFKLYYSHTFDLGLLHINRLTVSFIVPQTDWFFFVVIEKAKKPEFPLNRHHHRRRPGF